MINASAAASRQPSSRELSNSRSGAECRTESDQLARLPVAALAISVGIDLAALAVAVAGSHRPLSFLAAAGLHAAAVAVVLLLAADRLAGSRRTLVAAMIFTLPVVGVGLSLLSLGTEPGGDLAEPAPPAPEEPKLPDIRRVRSVAGALPACEILMVAPLDERRATLAALARRGDANAVALLRWLVSTGSEMAVEAALALDELGTAFEADLARRRAQLAQEPTAAAARAGAALIALALENGIVEPTMVKVLAEEAREWLARASALGKQQPRKKNSDDAATTLVRARLEMAAMMPGAALAILDQGLAGASASNPTVKQMTVLRKEASLLAHSDGQRRDSWSAAPPAAVGDQMMNVIAYVGGDEISARFFFEPFAQKE